MNISIQDYIDKVEEQKADYALTDLNKLQNMGIKNMVRVIEIKSEEDQEEVTRAKEKWARSHFKRLNKGLRNTNPINIEPKFRDDINTYYTFDLLHPSEHDL